MKFIIIGLGNFGSSLALELINEGHEVIGVDNSMPHVNRLQDRVTHTISMDTTEELAIQRLPLKEVDAVIIAIGEDVGASITTTALVRKYSQTRIIARAISDIHYTILESMNIKEIFRPEADYAQQMANRIALKGALSALVLDNKFEIIETQLPKKLIGKTLHDIDFRKTWHIILVTILRKRLLEKTLLGGSSTTHKVLGVVETNTEFKKDDKIVLFGKNSDIESFLAK